MCPFRINANERSHVMSDHNSIITEINLLDGQGNKERNKVAEVKKQVRWLLDEDGLANVETAAKALIETTQKSMLNSTQEKYEWIEEMLRNVMDSCFKRVGEKKKTREKFSPTLVKISENINKLAKRGKTERKIAQLYRKKLVKINEESVAERKAEALEKIIQQVTVDGNFNSQGFWKLRKALNNKTSACASVRNKDGKEVYGEDGIREVFKEEFETRLAPRDIEEGYEYIKERTELLCDIVLEKCGRKKEDNFSLGEYTKVKSRLKRGKATGMDGLPAELYIEGGDYLDKEILEALNEVKSEQETPNQWNNVGVTTIFKNKGSQKDLVNQRGIFLTQIISKLFERLVSGRVKGTTEKMNPLQAGGKDGRATYHQTFLLRGFISHSKYTGKQLIITLYDFKQCFDNLWLDDAVLSLWKLGLDSDMLPLIYNLNRESVITVKTPVGNT